jgi:hypothetical protein
MMRRGRYNCGETFGEEDSDSTYSTCSTSISLPAVSEVGLVAFDADCVQRPHILRGRARAPEPGVDVVDLLDGKHD